MYSRATTTITIYRGVTTDEWGDTKDTAAPIATGVKASIIEQGTYAKGEVTLQPRNIRTARLRVRNGRDVKINDRILDEQTNQIWVITNIASMQNPVIKQDMRIDLQYVGM